MLISAPGMRLPTLSLFAILTTALVLYWPGFGGFWLGDDLSNLHGAHYWAREGDLASLLHRQFTQGVSEGGGFFRPFIILSLYLNYLVAGDRFGGWFAVNLAVHLANTFLVAWAILRITRHQEAGVLAPWAAVVAAGLFALNPLIAEGVFWVSARSDGWVTLFALLGLLAWFGRPGGRGEHAWLLPTWLIPALLFKEPAAFLPFAVGLLWLIHPPLRTRARNWSLAVAFSIVAIFMAWRTVLFGNPWEVYIRLDPQARSGVTDKLLDAARGLPYWMDGLFGPQRPLATVLVSLVAIAALMALMASARRSTGVAVLVSAVGLVFLTFANLGGIGINGEGGRLLYTPMAFLALGIGAIMSGSVKKSGWSRRLMAAALTCALLALLLSPVLLQARLQHVWTVQDHLRGLIAALPEAVEDTTDHIIVLVPDHVGPVVVGRNGQGAMVTPPLQKTWMLHRAIPSLPQDLSLRHRQYTEGMRQRQNARAQAQGVQVEHDEDPWPRRVACWSPARAALVTFSAPDPANPDLWVAGLFQGASAAGCLFQ